MTIPVLVNGAFGKMGLEVVKAIQQDPAFELVGQTTKTDNLAQTINQSHAKIVIDFTTPKAVFENILTILETEARPVIGTTGLTTEQLQQIEKRCAELKRGAVIAPNFSIGAVLMMQFAEQAARFYSAVEIVELHHPGKLDAPSGTAIKTAKMIASQRHEHTEKVLSKETSNARGIQIEGIPVHAIRLPGFVSSQEVIFGETGETLTIQHNTIDRAAFMPGVLLVCKKVLSLNHLVYGLEHLL